MPSKTRITINLTPGELAIFEAYRKHAGVQSLAFAVLNLALLGERHWNAGSEKTEPLTPRWGGKRKQIP